LRQPGVTLEPCANAPAGAQRRFSVTEAAHFHLQ